VRDGLWRLARAVPSLDLRFADNKSLVDAVTGASLVTFTRASSGTVTDSAGVLQTAATDVPRFDHNPTTGESLGLLVEEQKTNLLTYSDGTYANGSAAGWSNTSSTVSLTTAPTGTNTAELWTFASGSIQNIFKTISCSASTAYTLSFYYKLGTLPDSDFKIAVRDDTAGVFIASDVSPTRTNVGNSWLRATYTFTTPVGCVLVRPYLLRFTPVTGGSIAFWGAQLEPGSTPSTYIPTTTAAVTRSADVASITGSAFSSWYSQSEGTLFAENSQSATSGDIAYSYYLDAGAGLANSIYADVSSGNRRGVVFSGNAVQCATNFGAITSGVQARTAFGLKQDQFGLVLNGGAVVVDSSGSLPTGLTRIFLGNNSASNAAINGHIRRLTFWGQRLPNNILQSITQ
jgi:hypothetical protein